MRRRSWRVPQWRLVAIALAIAATGGACAQPKESTVAPPPKLEGNGRTMASELSPEIKQMIDAARRLYDTPGLILDRAAIYETVNAQPAETRLFKTTEGDRHMNETLVPKKAHEDPRWRTELSYSQYSKKDSWVARVDFDISKSDRCYSSRLVEAYWGQIFIYQPLGTHAQLSEMLRPEGALPTGPHDGKPYRASFFSAHPNGANVGFSIGSGGCLNRITASNLFKFKEYSDDHIYHE